MQGFRRIFSPVFTRVFAISTGLGGLTGFVGNVAGGGGTEAGVTSAAERSRSVLGRMYLEFFEIGATSGDDMVSAEIATGG